MSNRNPAKVHCRRRNWKGAWFWGGQKRARMLVEEQGWLRGGEVGAKTVGRESAARERELRGRGGRREAGGVG
eukprot:2064063-Rhodomonas_salina.1